MHIHDNEDYLVINMKTWYNNYFTQNGLIFQHNCPQVNEFKQLVREHVVSIINEFGKEEGRAKPIHRKDILTEKIHEYYDKFTEMTCFDEWLKTKDGIDFIDGVNRYVLINHVKLTTHDRMRRKMSRLSFEDLQKMSKEELNSIVRFVGDGYPNYDSMGGSSNTKKKRGIKKRKKKKKRSTRKRNMWKEGDIKGHLTKTQKIKSILKKINALHEYNIHQEVGLYLPPSNQRHSGRCWLFSFLNSLRLSCIVKYKLPPTFSFSAAYMLFWDKYEKSKYFLDRVSSQSHLPMENVDNHFLFRSMISDGGTWNMLQNIVTTYGVVPYDSMKESHHTTNTNEMNDILIKFLQTSAKKIRASPPAKHTQLINDHMKKVYSLLTKCVGVPPKKVPSLKKNNTCTPLELYQNEISPLSSNDVMKKVVMIHVPNLKENQYYVIDELNNKTNGHVLYYYNVNLKVFKSSVLSQIKACSPAWFGCDFGKFNHKGESLLNDQAFSFDTFPLKKKELILPKSNAISMYQTNVNHAMLFTGYYYKNSHQKPYYWTIENSHGDKMKNVSYHSNHGFITMSDSWFDQYVVMAVVDETHFQGVINAKDKNNAIVLPKWSNLGELLFQ